MVAHLSMGQAGEFMGSSRQEPSPSPMLVAPSPVARSPPRLPSADHRLSIPERPSFANRRHSSAMSPLHGSRPHRSSPLAGPSIALSHDGTLKATSAPPTPGGGRHLSPLAEFSTTAAQVEDPGDDADSKKRRRRSLGAVLSKLSFPSAGPSGTSEPASPERESPVRPRQRSKSASSRPAPPVPAVPPVPAWAHNTLPARSMSPHKLSPPSSRSPTHTSPGSPSSSSSSPKSPRPSSPTPSARSNASRRSIIQTPTGSPVSARAMLSTSRNPEENWLTQAAAPRFSRLGLKAEGVVLPVSVREARRRSTASTLSAASRTKSADAIAPLARPGSASARSSTVGHAPANSNLKRMSVASTSTFTPSSVSHHSQSTSTSACTSASSCQSHSHSQHSQAHSSPSTPQRHRSRTSSFASASSGRASLDCDTPSLTMSPGPSASDVSLAPEPFSSSGAGVGGGVGVGVDEMGVLTVNPVGGVQLQLQLNDVPVGVIHVPGPEPCSESESEDVLAAAYPAVRDKGKGRAHESDYVMPVPPPVRTDDTSSSIASVGSIGSIVSERSAFTVPWARGSVSGSGSSLPASPSGSERSSYFGSAVHLPRHERAATAPSSGERKAGKENGRDKENSKEGLKKRSTLGRMWKQLVRSVTVRR